MEQKFCQSCGMPLTNEILGTNADGSKNEDYCMYCYKDGKFLQDCTMDEMIEHCAQFVDEVNKGLPQPITKEEYIGQMKMYFPHLKRWRKELSIDDDTPENPALMGVKDLIAKMADTLPITMISSVDEEGFPCTKAMLSPRVREGIKVFYFTTNTFSLRVAHYKANPKASIYFCDAEGFKGMMLRGTMEVLTDAKSKEMIWRDELLCAEIHRHRRPFLQRLLSEKLCNWVKIVDETSAQCHIGTSIFRGSLRSVFRSRELCFLGHLFHLWPQRYGRWLSRPKTRM